MEASNAAKLDELDAAIEASEAALVRERRAVAERRRALATLHERRQFHDWALRHPEPSLQEKERVAVAVAHAKEMEAHLQQHRQEKVRADEERHKHEADRVAAAEKREKTHAKEISPPSGPSAKVGILDTF